MKNYTVYYASSLLVGVLSGACLACHGPHASCIMHDTILPSPVKMTHASGDQKETWNVVLD